MVLVRISSILGEIDKVCNLCTLDTANFCLEIFLWFQAKVSTRTGVSTNFKVSVGLVGKIGL